MTSAPRTPTPERAPTLERRLRDLRAGLVRQALAYGAGTILGAASLWLAFAFLADWGLRVPHGIRILHGLALIGVVALFAWRDLVRPLRRLPEDDGLAILYERASPELRELLISAIQFQRDGVPADADPARVAAVVRAAEARAAALVPGAVVDPEVPRARLLLGSGGMLFLLALGLWNPLHATIFLERLVGRSTPWPQRTHLALELPGVEDGAFVSRTPELWRLRLARGSDLSVLVTAEGVVPDEVKVHIDGSRDLLLGPLGTNVFRTLLRSCQEDLAFRVTGGDDEDGLPRVEVEILQPPDVEGLAIRVRPPAYAGLPEVTYHQQDVDVLQGSGIEVFVLATPPDAQGIARLLPEDRLVPLEPRPFPPAPSPDDVLEAPRQGLGFGFVAEDTVGLRIELTDANGLSNPEPGLTRVRVVQDRPPELTVLAPSRGEFETVAGGAIPLRVKAEDDFGLTALRWSARPAAGGESVLGADLEPRAIEVRGRDVRAAALGSARIEVDALGGPEGPPAADSRFEIEFRADDNCEPTPGTGRTPPVRVRIVTREELHRRLQDRLAQARLDALRLSETQREKRNRIIELLDALDGDDAGGEGVAITAALSGERRVLSDAQALARSLAVAAEDVLYARLDDKAAALLEFYDARLQDAVDARFLPEPWRALASANAAGQLSTEGFAAGLVALVDLALEISEDHVTAAVEALGAAEAAGVAAEAAASLERAGEAVDRVLARTEDLLAALAEWDNFQNVLTLTRDILSRQKEIRDRTQQFAQDK
jgi:hypothetical protein